MSQVALAVDFGGTKVEAALVDATGTLLQGSRVRRPTGPEADSAALEAAVLGAVDGALAALGDHELLGAGIGAAGPITVADGLVSPLNVPAWRDYPLRTLVASRVAGLPTELQMDGIAITLAESWVGAAQGCTNLMGMIVSTGIGGGLLLDGRVVSGPTGNAGHIGHVEVGGHEERCACGGTGCLEAVASGPNSVRWARAQGFVGVTGEDLAAAHAAGDPIAIAAVRRAGLAIGRAIASTTALVDLEVVAIGGGFSQVAPELFDAIRESIAQRSVFGFVTKVRVVASGLSGDGPLVGAAALVHLPGALRS